MGNPCLTKWGRIVVTGICLVLIPASYLASYPLAYRALVGSDANRGQSVPASLDAARTCYPSLAPAPAASAMKKYRVWEWLQRNYFPPAEWLMDHTPARHPILALADLADSDEQIQEGMRRRAFWRRVDAIMATGGSKAVSDFLDQQIAILSRKMAAPADSSPADEIAATPPLGTVP